MLSPSLDKRILASDENRLVLAVHTPEQMRRPVQYLSLAALAAVAAGTAFLMLEPYMSATRAVILGLALFASGIAYTMTATVLVALRDRDELFLESFNRITRRSGRKRLGALSAVKSYEVASLLDTDTDMFPRPLYELRLTREADSIPVWYCGSREIATAAGEEIVRLARAVTSA